MVSELSGLVLFVTMTSASASESVGTSRSSWVFSPGTRGTRPMTDWASGLGPRSDMRFRDRSPWGHASPLGIVDVYDSNVAGNRKSDILSVLAWGYVGYEQQPWALPAL